MRPRSLSFPIAAVIAALTVGCTSAPAPASISVEDLSGRVVELPAPAERVVCLDGTCIDALAELGLEPVASAQIDQVRHPLFFGEDATTEELGGTFFEPDLEAIVAADPDLVIGSASVHEPLVSALGDIPFYGNAIAVADDAVPNLQAIGELTGLSAEADAAIERYEATLAAYAPGSRDTTVLSMYGGATDDIGIDALDSSIGSLLAQYTAYPWPSASEGESGFLEIGIDDILDVDPEHIWILDFGFDPDAEPLVEQLADDPVWAQLHAVEADAVHVADAAWWGTTAGTRGQQAVLDTVLPVLHPDEFASPLSGLGA